MAYTPNWGNSYNTYTGNAQPNQAVSQYGHPLDVPGGHGGVTGGQYPGGYQSYPGGVQTADAGGPDPWASSPSKDVSQEQWDKWRKDNPGDEDRWKSAFPSGGGGGGGASGGGGKSGGSGATPSPFILPNGQIPPGMPFSPNMEMQGYQDNILRQILQNPVLGPEQIGMMNEAQKELALTRGQESKRAFLQDAANRGTLGGGYTGGVRRRMNDALTQQLLQSNRDVSMNAANINRQGFLDALMSSNNILGGREDRGLNYARFAEGIRQYDQDLDWRYNSLNAQMEQDFIRRILGY